ncbi:MAG: S8 family serine peptidase [Piscinibacter sp.]|nr:S8 family serine peptidase [Piscinibacter sp.]
MNELGWRGRFRRAWGIACLSAGLAFAASAEAAGARGLIVKLRDVGAMSPRAEQRLQEVLAKAGVRESARGRAVGRHARYLDFGHDLDPADVQRIAADLLRRPEVEWVVPNDREQRLNIPQDPLYAATPESSGQWWLFPAGGTNTNEIDDRRRGVPGLQQAWATNTGIPSTVVAVLDTGITAHPDLDANMLPGRDFVSVVEYANDGDGWDADASDPGDWVSEADRQASPALFGSCAVDDSSWHGTIIAGQIGAVANNAAGVAGATWGARVLPVRVAGKCGADLADILVGMRWAAGLPVYDAEDRPVPLNPTPARVLNISFGGSAACNPAYQETIDELAAIGVVVVAAAGNQSAAPTRPANCLGVLGVAALNRDGFKSSYSNFGPAVAIATVGGDPRLVGNWGLLLGDDGLLTVANGGLQSPGAPGYGRTAGTSFAAPVVAGVAALMLGVNPSLSVAQLIDGVRRSARPHVLALSSGLPACSADHPGRCACTRSTCGAGILDAPQALAYARDPAAYVPPALLPELIDTPELKQALALGDDVSVAVAPVQDAGGGAVGGGWLFGLGLALVALRRRNR